MSVIYINVLTAGQVGVKARRIQILSTASLATVTTAGYLNNKNLMGYTISPTDIVDMYYDCVSETEVGTLGTFTSSIDAGVITLNAWENPANVLLPVVSNDFANFNGTSGQIKDSGYSPTNAAKTKVVMLNATPVANNLAKFSAADGTVADAGARIIASTTATYAGGGTSNTFTAAGLTSAAKGSAVIRASTNSVSITKALPGTDSLAITFSGDPGAGTTVDYIYSTASQA